MPAETEAATNMQQHNQEDEPLPELAQGELDPETFAALHRDYRECCTILAVLPKTAAASRAPDMSIPLDQGMGDLQNGSLRGLQVRYQYQGDEWWDTLLRTPQGGIRLVRIRQEYQ